MPTLSINTDLSRERFDLAVDESIPLQDITALFGASGAGKTTLLRVIAGLEQSARGSVSFDDEIWQDSEHDVFVAPYRRSIGFVFQDARLFPHLSVSGNLDFAARRASDAAGPTLDDVVAQLELGEFLPRDPESLSGGELQRVSIARALLRKPSLLLMDEPLSALDASRKAEILPYIEALAPSFGIPVVYVTHNVDEVARLASRIVVMSAGRVVAAGGAAEVLERTDLRPLAEHFEAGVLLAARAAGQRDGMTTLDVGGQLLRVPAVAIDNGREFRIRVLARDVALATQTPQGLSIRNVLESQILTVEMGDDVVASVLLDVGGQHLRSTVTREAVEELGLAAGMKVFALIKSVAIDLPLVP
ncbi:MAG TPA: molybdenum ABC transporter ATP-binding protein [Gammaproteobacteria bacterium]